MYSEAAKSMVMNRLYTSIPQLVNCIRNDYRRDAANLTKMCDEMLTFAAKTLANDNATDQQLEDVIKHISNRTIKVSNIKIQIVKSKLCLSSKLNCLLLIE